MEILFATASLRRDCSDAKRRRRRWGESGERLGRRLDDLQAAPNLAAVLPPMPGRLHALVKDRAGQFSMDLKHPYRLILEPADDPIPPMPDGGIDLGRVTAMRVIGVEDTHG